MKMRVAMVYPTRESEKAISGYSSTLVDNIKKSDINIDELNYNAGSPITLFKKFNEFKKYDLIHIQHEYNMLGWYGLPFFVLYILLFISGRKVITTMHTILSQREKFNENKIKTLLRKALYITQNRWINWFSDMIVVHTDFLKKTLSHEYNVNKNKIIVLPQGIIENVPKYNKQKMKKELKLSGPVYLLIGSMVPDHGHDIIIKQADKIGKTILVVANPGAVNDRNSERTRNYLEENKQTVKKNHSEKFVRFDISEDITDKNPVWWKYFAAADLVLLSYRVGHGSGIFAHSIAANCPVIGSNVNFFNEIAKKYKCVAIANNNEDYPRIIKESMILKNYKVMKEECVRYLRENGLYNIATRYRKLYLASK